MAGFGGAVKLTGESEYRKAIQQITQDLAKMSSALKTQAADFSANSGNMKNAEKQQKELNNAIKQQQEYLQKAKAAYATAGVELEAQKVKNAALTKEYKSAVAELYRLADEVGTTSKEYQDQEKIIEQLTEALAESNASMNESKSTMSALKRQIDEATRTIEKTTAEIDMLGESTANSGKDAEKASGGFTVFKGVLANLSSQAITSVINGLKQLGGALVNVGKQAIGSYAEFEQLEGGVKKIFGDELADEVIKNADVAFKTAGMSANEYLETVTNFSATLMQGLGENTSQAAKYADMAIRNMSDNANTFGTDIASIQNAYQGFAKDNYTMLDNLKLGYGGTASEMARLINESGVLGKEIEITAKTVKDVPFYKMIEAIDQTQKRMGIMGTTAKEASGTIQGSTGSMRAAWQNLLTGLVDDEANFEQLTSDFIGTLISEDGKGGMIGTLLPRISTVISGISNMIATLLPKLINNIVPMIEENLPVLLTAVENALKSVVEMLPSIIPTISKLIPKVVSTIVSLLPQLVSAGIQIIISVLDGIKDAIPDLLNQLPKLIKEVCDTIIQNIPQIIDVVLAVVEALAQGLLDAIPELLKVLPDIILSLVDTLLGEIPKIIECGIRLLSALVENMPVIIENIIQAIPKILFGLRTAIMEHLPEIMEMGTKLFVSLIMNLPEIIQNIVSAIPEIISGLLDALVESMPQMIKAGEDLIKGLWEGIKNTASWIYEKMKGFCSGIVSHIKEAFGIASPSKLFRDEIGVNLALGIGEGFMDEMKRVSEEMIGAIPKSVPVQAIESVSSYGNMSNWSFDTIVEAFKEALSEVKIEIDDEVAGKFVENTVTRLVYA